MGVQYWTNPLAVAPSDGPTLVATAAASCLPPAARCTLPNNFFDRPGKLLRITATGRISCAAGSPGTARYDVRFGPSAGAIVVFDSLAMNLNAAGKINVGWKLELLLTCRTIGNGALATLLGQGTWTSEAGIGAPAVTAGGNAVFLLPYNAIPAPGTGFDATAAQQVDLFYTPSVATGAMTLHQYLLEEIG
jgi:hypothetical protein